MNAHDVQSWYTPNGLLGQLIQLTIGSSGLLIFTLYGFTKSWVTTARNVHKRVRQATDTMATSAKAIQPDQRAARALLNALLIATIAVWPLAVVMTGYFAWIVITAMRLSYDTASAPDAIAMMAGPGTNPLNWLHWTPYAQWWLIGSIPIWVYTAKTQDRSGCLAQGVAFLLTIPAFLVLLVYTVDGIVLIAARHQPAQGEALLVHAFTGLGVAFSSWAAAKAIRELWRMWFRPTALR